MVHPSAKELRGFRLMLGIGGATYLVWWFAVEALLPGAFNPLFGRLCVVAYFLAALAATFVSDAARKHAGILFYTGAMALIAHYFYLFHNNASDINWVVGAYVVVFALSVGVQARGWLISLSVFSLSLGMLVWALDPVLQKTIFLPGLATINTLCIVMLFGRLRLVSDLSETTARFQNLFDATFEGVVVHQEGKIVEVNAAAAAIFGYTRAELIGKQVRDVNAPEYRELVSQKVLASEHTRYESVALRRDGSRVPIEISSKPYDYQGRHLRLAAVRDMSEHKRAEEERAALMREQSARATAQDAIRLRDEFISIASHELRTPLTSLQLQFEAFDRSTRRGAEYVNLAEELKTYSTRTRRQIARLNRLVDELLDVSRLDGRELPLQRAPMELGEVVRGVVDELAEDLRRAGCTIVLPDAPPIDGAWDQLRLEQVVTNLVRNAMIYGAGKPIDIILKIEGDNAVIGVRDHGMGIDKVDQERIFKRFERVASARHYGGLGLGLYIAKQIVEAHQGRVRVESAPGQGATFWVELPRRA